jgi:hypothetical protein
MYTVQIAEKKINRLIEEIGDRKMTIPTLCRYLNKTFRSMSVRFTSKLDDYFAITGMFGGNLKVEDELRYNIHVHYDRKKEKIFPADSLLEAIFIVMVHEFRHGYQDTRRRKRILPIQRTLKFKHSVKTVQDSVNYLSDYDEIDAYAFEVAHAIKNGHKGYFWITQQYKKTLGKHAPELYKKFLKKVYLFSHK